MMCAEPYTSDQLNPAFAGTPSPVEGTVGTPSQGQSGAVAIALGGLKPYHVPVAAGMARILLTMHAPMLSKGFNAPFSSVIGQKNAVALSMVVAGLFLWKLGDLISKKKWHETTLGLILIVLGSLLSLVLLSFVT
jgi:hypothetical protein